MNYQGGKISGKIMKMYKIKKKTKKPRQMVAISKELWEVKDRSSSRWQWHIIVEWKQD